MEGIQFWAQSNCRSTIAFYIALASYFGVPYRICTGFRGKSRLLHGWQPSEFEGANIVHTDYDIKTCNRLFEEKAHWHQFFGVYQQDTSFVSILSMARTRSPGVGIGSEAPLNMFQPGLKRFAKALYLKYLLPLKLSKRIEGADFFLNYSGRFTGGINLGWDSIRVINAGYYPPPLPGSKFVDRTGSTSRGRKKKLFLSGVESWHRGGDILWRTLKKLREYWPKFEVFSTGNGPATVKLLSGEDCLPITFTGYLDLPTLITQYETCDAFLALGHEEPWGIRVNDALNCGAPVIISNGMGSSTVVSQYKCGWVFRAGSEDALADAIIHFISDEVGYRQRAANVRAASKAIAPANAAMLAGKEIADRFLNWRPSS